MMRTLILWALCLFRLVLADVMDAFGRPMTADNAGSLGILTMIVFLVCVFLDVSDAGMRIKND